MDDKDSSKEYSRPPTIDDLVLLCRLLNEAGVKYLIVGGFAVIYHGYTRGTEDIDLLIDPDEENVRKIKEALLALPDGASKDIRETDIKEYTVVRIADEFVVDLIAKACGVDYEQAKSHIIYSEIDNVMVPFADIEILIEMKKSIRPKDEQDMIFLNRMKREKE